MSIQDIRLPAGRIIQAKDVPADITQEEFKNFLISNGQATEEDFISAAPSETPKPVESPTGVLQEMMQKVKDSYNSKQIASPYDQSIGPDSLGHVAKILNTPTRPPNVNAYTSPLPATFGLDAQDMAANERQRMLINNAELQQKQQMAADAPFIAGVVEGVGNIGKQYKAGIGKLVNQYSPRLAAGAYNYLTGNAGKTSEEIIAELDNEMSKHNKDYEIFKDENPMSTLAGEMATFMGTGGAGSKFIDATFKTINPLLKSASIGMNRAGGKFIPSMESAAKRIESRPDYIPTAGALRSMDLAKGAITGAAESSLMDDGTWWQGALSPFIGLPASIGPLRTLNKMHNYRDEAGKKLISEMHEAGMEIPPGVYTGNQPVIREENAILKSNTLGQSAHNMITEPNNRVYMKMMGDAIGMDLSNKTRINKVDLYQHLSGLKRGYQDLEAKTEGIYGPQELLDVGAILKKYQPTTHKKTSDRDNARYEMLKSVAGEIQSAMLPRKPGPFTGERLDGAKYQDLRRLISDEIDTANMSDRAMVEPLQQIRSIIDRTLENGMGEGTLAEWKKLNERYFLTNAALKKGLTPSRMVDPDKLKGWLMSDDEVVRTLTGQGNPEGIGKFQKIVEYNDVMHGKDIPTSDISTSDTNTKRGMFKTASDYVLDPVKEGILSYRLNTSRLPFIGPYFSLRHGVGEQTSYRLGRAAAQSANVPQYIEDLYKKYKEASDDTK